MATTVMVNSDRQLVLLDRTTEFGSGLVSVSFLFPLLKKVKSVGMKSMPILYACASFLVIIANSTLDSKNECRAFADLFWKLDPVL